MLSLILSVDPDDVIGYYWSSRPSGMLWDENVEPVSITRNIYVYGDYWLCACVQWSTIAYCTFSTRLLNGARKIYGKIWRWKAVVVVMKQTSVNYYQPVQNVIQFPYIARVLVHVLVLLLSALTTTTTEWLLFMSFHVVPWFYSSNLLLWTALL